jgi:hypothetical protein
VPPAHGLGVPIPAKGCPPIIRRGANPSRVRVPEVEPIVIAAAGAPTEGSRVAVVAQAGEIRRQPSQGLKVESHQAIRVVVPMRKDQSAGAKVCLLHNSANFHPLPPDRWSPAPIYTTLADLTRFRGLVVVFQRYLTGKALSSRARAKSC